LYQFPWFRRNMPERFRFDWPNFWRSLIAVLAGNAIYYAAFPHLPWKAQHQLYQIDWGLAVDFWVCLACWGIIRMIR
jgi:hypothetical protein